MKKIIAIIGSQRKKGTYDAVLKFGEAFKSYGEIEFEAIFLNNYNLEFCTGCKLCFDKGEEYCPLKDDRDILIEKISRSDGVIRTYTIKPTQAPIWNTAKYDNEKKRQSDMNIFCLLANKDKNTLNPLDMSQWDFFVVPTSLFDRLFPLQQSIALSALLKHGIASCKYTELRSCVDEIIRNL